jgi:hypothetical protein
MDRLDNLDGFGYKESATFLCAIPSVKFHVAGGAFILYPYLSPLFISLISFISPKM